MKLTEASSCINTAVESHCHSGSSPACAGSVHLDEHATLSFFKEAQKRLHQHYGFDATRRSRISLKRAIQTRTRELGITDPDNYLALLLNTELN
jgi:hypothetical protein